MNKDYEYELSVDDVKEDINYYVSNNFESIQIHRFDDKNMNDIYSKNVKIDNYFIEHNNYNMINNSQNGFNYPPLNFNQIDLNNLPIFETIKLNQK